jgi:hypothetical protein
MADHRRQWQAEGMADQQTGVKGRRIDARIRKAAARLGD